jgi:hypothetical protein
MIIIEAPQCIISSPPSPTTLRCPTLEQLQHASFKPRLKTLSIRCLPNVCFADTYMGQIVHPVHAHFVHAHFVHHHITQQPAQQPASFFACRAFSAFIAWYLRRSSLGVTCSGFPWWYGALVHRSSSGRYVGHVSNPRISMGLSSRAMSSSRVAGATRAPLYRRKTLLDGYPYWRAIHWQISAHDVCLRAPGDDQ